jgi:hypothetical protein
MVLRKVASHFSPLASSKAVCVNLQNEQMNIMHHMQLPFLPPGEHNPAQSLGRLNPPPTKLKSINSELQSDSGGGVEH